jgi:hypothetical protein
MKKAELCSMCSFDLQVYNAIDELTKKYGLVVNGSVIPVSKGNYKIRFTAVTIEGNPNPLKKEYEAKKTSQNESYLLTFVISNSNMIPYCQK